MTKVLVTGARGMLGQDLCPMLLDKGFDVFQSDIHNMDITDLSAVQAILTEQKPDFIVHAAAYTNVDAAETDQERAMLINKTGSENIAKAAAEIGTPVFYISTDYVFDGTKTTPYTPDDRVKPVNFYGKTKLEGENAVKQNNPRHYIFRTSWLYGHHGKNFVETMVRLAGQHSELRVVYDQVGCPTWTKELARVVIDFIQNPRPFGTYHVCGSGTASWHGFACKIMELMGIEIPVTPVTTPEFPTPAKRPAYSVMDNNDLCADWQDSLKEYIELRNMLELSGK